MITDIFQPSRGAWIGVALSIVEPNGIVSHRDSEVLRSTMNRQPDHFSPGVSVLVGRSRNRFEPSKIVRDVARRGNLSR